MTCYSSRVAIRARYALSEDDVTLVCVDRLRGRRTFVEHLDRVPLGLLGKAEARGAQADEAFLPFPGLRLYGDFQEVASANRMSAGALEGFGHALATRNTQRGQ